MSLTPADSIEQTDPEHNALLSGATGFAIAFFAAFILGMLALKVLGAW